MAVMVAGIDDIVSLSARKDRKFCLLVRAGGDNGRTLRRSSTRLLGRAGRPIDPRLTADMEQLDREDIMAASDEDDRPKRKPLHEIGQDLTLLSIEELSDRISLLNDEIARLQAALEKKRASRDAASQFFKR